MRWLAVAAAQPAEGLAADDLGAGVGQSSWGPTGFALLPSAARAQALIDAARAAGVFADGLQWRIACPLNHGARITTEHLRAPHPLQH